MADIVNSRFWSCLPLPIYNLLRCFGFESNNPSSLKPPIADAGIPPPPVSEDYFARDETIVSVFPSRNYYDEAIHNLSSVKHPTADAGFPPPLVSEDYSAGDETIVSVFPSGNYYDEAMHNPSSEKPPAADAGIPPPPVSEDYSSAGNNPSYEKYPSNDEELLPSSTDVQFPVNGDDFAAPKEGLTFNEDWGRADPILKRLNRGAPGKTN